MAKKLRRRLRHLEARVAKLEGRCSEWTGVPSDPLEGRQIDSATDIADEVTTPPPIVFPPLEDEGWQPGSYL